MKIVVIGSGAIKFDLTLLDEFSKALISFAESIETSFNELKELFCEIGDMHEQIVYESHKTKYPLIRQIKLQSQVSIRKPKVIKARSLL